MHRKSKNQKLCVHKDSGIQENQIYLVSKFIVFCARVLPVNGNFEIHIVSDREESGITTTAAYHPGMGKVVVYGKNRALVDIMRSVAHEMVHMMQDEMGMIKGKIRDIGGFHENQANAGSGALIKAFAKVIQGGEKIYESKRN